ncbi:PadR family transcriptional regulator [Streptomyces sp. NPDC058092]|uniref:PadR family transcriptional regulator n=1 Tax=Streptomyces sp. NPDC058092 TaxID=3346336 RepID=UPI0036E402B1
MEKRQPTLTEPQYFILAALMDGPLHGYGIIKATERATDGRLRIAVGTLYGPSGVLERELAVAADAVPRQRAGSAVAMRGLRISSAWSPTKSVCACSTALEYASRSAHSASAR